MVDTRETESRSRVQALTINGKASVIVDRGKTDAVRSQIKQRHAHLQDLPNQPDIAFICVGIETIQLQNGVHETHFVRLSGTDD